MNDAELRGRLLTTFYTHRHNAQGWVPTSDINASDLGSVTNKVIGGICRQLADFQLIRWKPLIGGQEGFIEGMAQITGAGMALVEGRGPAPLPIIWPLTIPTDETDPAAVRIVPTLYPAEPDGNIEVQHSISVAIESESFHELELTISSLVEQLRLSNTIAGETRDKLIAEVTAGFEILKSPKPDPALIDILLKRPLIFIADKSAGVIVGAIATAALALLGKVSGLW